MSETDHGGARPSANVSWRETPPSKEGFYWLKRRDGSHIVVCISRSLLAFSTHGHVGSKPSALQGLWSGPLTPPPNPT